MVSGASQTTQLPVAVIGAGPVGLAAAAHLLERGLEPLVLEAGDEVGAAIREWGHVRLFSPWEYDVDAAAARLLAASSPGAAAQGDVSQGSRQFQTWCSGCHGPGGVGPDIRSPGSPGATVSAETLLPLVREGVGHPEPPDPPGVYSATEITDKQVADIAAYLNDQAAE